MKMQINCLAILLKNLAHLVCFFNTVYIIFSYVFCYLNIAAIKDISAFVTEFDKF